MKKPLILIGMTTLLLSGCNSDNYQANILNTASNSDSNYDISLPSPTPAEVLIDDANFFAHERQNNIANMRDILTDKKLTLEDMNRLFEYQQDLLMTDPYEKQWQNKIQILQEKLIWLEVIIRDDKSGLEDAVNQVIATLDKLAI
ncbi:MAG: hypothetical protein A2V81_01960 [Candidatus Abawacabacteria bacterium RBG_16_42_10]|uniref:Uncharacterized protein n=1 Tax=Candidatus Abawacabacteria bacterium RBG_16_42_10 TaxID=1817814 RepID=A0A1F4XKV2_9BACT|nr:MAG: hypothetical protein A2V81_01960 [Candidatus Abawacabacteria bacterium RBG_16_42_10]